MKIPLRQRQTQAVGQQHRGEEWLRSGAPRAASALTLGPGDHSLFCLGPCPVLSRASKPGVQPKAVLNIEKRVLNQSLILKGKSRAEQKKPRAIPEAWGSLGMGVRARLQEPLGNRWGTGVSWSEQEGDEVAGRASEHPVLLHAQAARARKPAPLQPATWCASEWPFGTAVEKCQLHERQRSRVLSVYSTWHTAGA